MIRVRRGITLMETVLGVLLVGGVLAGTLEIIGPTARASQLAGDEVLAAQLADELIEEINSQPYEDPDEILGLISLETGETLDGKRTTFDDVDDYNGWSGAVTDPSGNPRAGLVGTWVRSAAVVFVQESDLTAVRADDGGIKRVTVTVSRGGITLATRQILRTRASDESRSAE